MNDHAVAPHPQRTRSILHVADYAPSYSGNFVASLKLAAAECRARGFRVVWVFPEEVASYGWFRELAEESHSVAYLISRTAGIWKQARYLADLAIQENAAIVHTHFSRFDLAAFTAKVLCAFRRHRFELVWHVHSAFTDEQQRWRRLKDYVKLGILGRFAYAVPVSYPLGDALRERGFPGNRIEVIQNGIDVAHATAHSRARSEMRRQLRLPEHAFVMLAFAWTPIRKGVDTMLQALPLCNDASCNPQLVLVGTEELKNYLAAWPDKSQFKCVHVIPPEEFVGDLFAACDVFLSPSRAEGWPYSVAEAMANSVPVATCAIPAMSWAKEAPGVFFSGTGNAAELAANIRSIANLPQAARAELGAQARAFICTRHTVENWGRSVWSFYARLLGWKEPPPKTKLSLQSQNSY